MGNMRTSIVVPDICEVIPTAIVGLADWEESICKWSLCKSTVGTYQKPSRASGRHHSNHNSVSTQRSGLANMESQSQYVRAWRSLCKEDEGAESIRSENELEATWCTCFVPRAMLPASQARSP